MKNLIIFGAGGSGMRYSNEILKSNTDKIICFIDNSKAKQGSQINGIDVFAPEKIHELVYDEIVIVASGFEDDILQQLKNLGVQESIINIEKTNSHAETRITWLSDFSKIVYSRRIAGNVAEAGVFRGDFAKHINLLFPDKTLYLFDTFEGFPEQDVEKEKLLSNSKTGYYDATSVELVLNKMQYKDKVIINKGYFPPPTIHLEWKQRNFVF